MRPIYISKQHEVIIQSYLDSIHESVNELTTQSKYNDFLDISNIIIEYHNAYSEGKHEGNLHDFLMIIPVNFSTMVSGFFCGLENKDNASSVRVHRQLLFNYSLKVIQDLQEIQILND